MVSVARAGVPGLSFPPLLNPARRHFLPWDRPLLPQAVEWLAGDWDGRGPLDLSHTLVVVPTRQSGRRLRESLAAHAATHGSAVFPPEVVTPDALVVRVRESADAQGLPASRLAALLAWVEVLRGADLEEFREVFPVDPPARDFTWAFGLADRLARLQATLGENDLTMDSVARIAGSAIPETARWEQLAALEQRFFQRLRAAGFRSPWAGAPGSDVPPGPVPEGIERVVVLATVDPLAAAVRILAEWLAHLVVDVVVFAPPECAGEFDEWGRPVSAVWANRGLEFPDFESRTGLCADPADQASRLAALAESYAQRSATAGAMPADAVVAFGIADAEIVPALESAAGRRRVAVFNPEGEARRNGALYHLLVALSDCAQQPGIEAVEAIARCPDFLASLGRQLGPGFSAARFLVDLDALRQRHLPADLAAAREHATGETAAALAFVAELSEALSAQPFPEAASEVPGRLFAGRVLNPADEADAQLQDAATAWTGVVRDCAQAVRRFPGFEAKEWWRLALRVFGESRRSDEKPAGAIELQGWLELLFEDAPHLVVAGFNDGRVPEAVSEDAFLPESLRARLGLKTNAARLARDAYLLQALSKCRGPRGRLDVLLGKTSLAGDPLRPSRLLLRCPDPELPRRIAFLFRAPELRESHLPWTRAWRVQPRVAAPPPQVAVTSLRAWLACPFRFYLRYVLRMEAVDATKSEMDALDFGSLCHGALEAMGRDAAMRQSTDPAVLREFLLAELNREAVKKFGAWQSLPLLIQMESARQRLAKVAELQAAERQSGWVIEAVERPFTVEFGGLTVKGKIDRIDRHEQTGAVRVLDYKTSDSAVNPATAHLRGTRDTGSRPAWSVVTVDDKARVWTDLQLPLYRQALAAEWGDDIICGYVNLPKAVGQTTIALWDDYTIELQRSAMACAAGVCGAIAAGEFWPPNEGLRAEDDDFAALFHEGVAASVDWAGVREAPSAP